MNIKIAESQKEKDQLDELLWQVLWKPLNLPRDTRSKVALSGAQIEIIAVDDKKITGGLVAYRIDEDELEIRHLAVDENCQRKSIGTNVILHLFDLIKRDSPVRIQTYVRNKSYPFFVKQGFVPVNEKWLEHPNFTQHGIRFKFVEKYV